MKNDRHAYGFIPFCTGVLLIVLLLQLFGNIRNNSIVFPDIAEIGRTFTRMLAEKKTYYFILTTLIHVSEALIISMGAGMVLGILEGLFSWIHLMFQPVMILVRSMPMIILIIIIMTMVSYRYVPVTAGSLMLLPVISEAVYEGLHSIPAEMIDVYKINSNMNLQVIRHVYLPLIAGYIRQAFTNAAGIGMKIIVSAEYLVQTKESLGKAIYSSSYFNEYAEIYSYALIMVLLVFLFSELPVIIIRKMKKYHIS